MEGENTFKLNTDAAMAANSSCGIGAIISDSDGNSMAPVCWKIQCLGEATVAEAMGIRKRMSFALEMLLLKLIVESDCLSLISSLQKHSWASSYVGRILSEYKLLEAQFYSISYANVCREGNKVTHLLAKLVLENHDQYWIEEDPPIVANCISMDLIPVV